MPFAIQTAPVPNSQSGEELVILSARDESARVTIAPCLGFNAVSWQTRVFGKSREWLYSSPSLWQDRVPTRSGIPVLFPFPNRIRDGKLSWGGKDFQLPINDPSHKNSIHGFACRHSWRIVSQGSDDQSAWVTGEFHASVDAPEVLELWPADHRIRLTYRLTGTHLDLQATVDNPCQHGLPFGLGFHPYFTLLGTQEETLVQVPAHHFWELEDSLPTGRTLAVSESRDLRQPRPCENLAVDDLLTDLHPLGVEDHDLNLVGRLANTKNSLGLQVLVTRGFRDMVVFIPPHRQAICLEPYTCPTDAIHLDRKGLNTGWMILPPGGSWEGTVCLRINS